MERRAKERLIGASILVVLVVLIVPELLSGPKPAAPIVPLLPAPNATAPESVRTVTVDLATSKSTPTDADTNPLESAANPNAPAPSAAQDAASTPALNGAVPNAPSESAPRRADPKPPVKAAAPAPGRTLDSSSAAPTSTREWAVQLGSFANRGNAENLVHQLKSQGFPVYDSTIGSGQSQRFRVRVGPLPDRAAADRSIAKLKAMGHAASVVPPAH